MANTNYIVLIQQTLSNNSGSNTLTIEAPMPESFNFDVGATYEQMLPQGLSNNKVLNIAAALNGTKLAVQAFTAQLWSGSTETDLTVEIEFHTESDPVADVRTPIVNLLKMVIPSVSSATGFLSSPGPYLDWAAAGSAVKTTIQTAIGSGESVLGAFGSAGSSFVSGLLGTTPKPSSMTDSNTQTTDGANNATSQSVTQNPGIGSAAYWKSLIKNPISIWIGNYLKFDSVVITNVRQTFLSNFDAQTGLPHHARVMVSFKPLFMLTQGDLDSLFVNPGSNSTPSSSSASQFSLGSGAGIPQANTFGVSGNSAFKFNL
jgi:hypothetical protein